MTLLQSALKSASSTDIDNEESDPSFAYNPEENVDQAILTQLGVSINKRLSSPIVAFAPLVADHPPPEFKAAVEALLAAFRVKITRNSSSTSSSTSTSKETEITLSYPQHVALLNLFGDSPELRQVFQSFTRGMASNVTQLRGGVACDSLNMFQHPSISFVLQMTEKLRAFDDSGDGDALQSEQYQLMNNSLEFSMNAMRKIEEASSAMAIGDHSSAISLLSEDLLDVLETATSSSSPRVCVPVYLHVQLLLDR